MSNEKSKKFNIKNVIIGVAIVIIVVIGLTIPLIAKANKQKHVLECASNMKQIHCAIVMFAEDYEDKIPTSINDLVADNLLDKKATYCPCDSQKLEYALLLTQGSTLTAIQSPSETPIIVCKCHEGTEIVLYADGNVKQNMQ